MGHLGEQPPRALLCADERRPQATRIRGVEVGAAVGRGQPGVDEDMTMRPWHILRSRLRSLLFRARRESDLGEELQLLLERGIERLQANAVAPEEARCQG